MERLMRGGDRIVAAIWMGGGLFLAAVAAPSAFRYAGTPTEAGNVVGAMLAWWHYLALIAPSFLLVRRLRRAPSGLFIALLAVSISAAAGQIAADGAASRIRREAPRPISMLRKSDPIRRRFGMLHGVSSVLLLLQIGCAAALVGRDEPPAAGNP